MSAQISSLEIQLIKSSLATKTDQEIAELLEILVEDVFDIINDITEGGAADRNIEIEKQRQERSLANQRKKQQPRIRKAVIKKPDEKPNRNADVVAKWEKQGQANKLRENRRSYKTRVIDMTKMISVKLDDRTHVLIERQETELETQVLIDQAKVDYELRKKNSPLYKDNKN